MGLIQRTLPLFLFSAALTSTIQAQVPVPHRDSKANPYSGIPNQPGVNAPQTRQELAEQEEALDTFVTPRIFRNLFDTALPSVFLEGEWSIRLNPKLGDFFDDENVRFPIGVEYNFSNNFEGFLDVGTYFPSPLNSGGSWGTYNLRVGGKYSWWNISETDYHFSAGFQSDMPWSSPPIEVSDGWARHEPFIALSRELGDDPAKLVYLNLAYELIEESPFESQPISPQPRDRFFVRPGLIFYPGGNFRYSTEFEYRTNTFDKGSPDPADFVDWIGTREYTRAFSETHEFFVSPGITWFPTEEFRKGFFVPGNWDIGLRLKIPIIEETDEDVGVSIRFRWYYDYDKYLKKYIQSFWPLGRGE